MPGNPVAIAITPDGSTAYALLIFNSAVTPIALAANSAQDAVGTSIPIGGAISTPEGIAIAGDGQTALVVGEGTGAGLGVTELLTLASGTVQAQPQAPDEASFTAAATSPDGSTWLVGGWGSSTQSAVYSVSVSTGAWGDAIPVDAAAYSIAFAPSASS